GPSPGCGEPFPVREDQRALGCCTTDVPREELPVFFRQSASLPTPDEALPGRAERPFRLAERHLVLDAPLEAPVPDGYEESMFGLGCLWGAEEVFWKVPGFGSTSVGYAGGHTPNPTYEEVCSGRTGH